MSSAEQEKKRREALDALKKRKLAAASVRTSAPPESNGTSSPESHILVPPSSSPTSTPARTGYSNGYGSGHGAAGGAYGAKLSYNGASTGIIPSSRIGGGQHAPSYPVMSGSPKDVMKSMYSRHATTAADAQTPAGSSSHTSSLADLSPSTPQPLSRLKAKYADPDDPESPQAQAQARKNGHGSSPISSSTSTSRQPSLVLAARSQQDSIDEELVGRFSTQFPRVPRSTVITLIKKYSGDPDRAINHLHSINDGLTSSPVTHTAPSTTIKPKFEPFKLAGNSNYSISPSSSSSSRPTFVQRIPQPASAPPPRNKSPPKPKRNEKSTIYANRGANGKRRDPDEDSSNNEASDAESDMSWSGDEGRKKKRRKGDKEVDAEGEALKAFNEVTTDVFTGTIACTVEQAATIIRLRPYADVDELRTKLTKARGVSIKLFEQYTEIMEGYVQIDACLNRCEEIAAEVASTLAVWRGASMAQDSSVIGTPRSDGLNDVKVDVAKVSELLKNETDQRKRKILSKYIQTQPATLSEGTVLKDYQLLGINWLNLLYSKKIGCILADEMGLGKTIQVIAFIASLKERGNKGPHMIFVPASTLENWTREFDRFAPEIDVQTYYGSQAERAALRDDLKRRYRANKLQVVLASYTQVAAPDDLNFFRKKIAFETCIYDEGHRLKSCLTKAYSDLLSIKPKWRLLLTGTPLQNNLQELVSLLMFIHKDTFADAEPYLRAIFKSQGANVLAQQRTSRARVMLNPFVLRRRKAQVLDLPPKIESVEHCEMTKIQAKLYNETMQRSKKVLQELSDDALEAAADDEGVVAAAANGTGNGKAKGKNAKSKKPTGVASSSSNILMDLRKAASHPLLFRRLYTDAKIKKIAKDCLNTPTYCDSVLEYVIEDLEVMSDYEISRLCSTSIEDELRKHALDPSAFLEGGKVAALQKHIERCKAEGKRMLLFSQFVMILDILEVALEHLGVEYTRLDGQTKTDERQGLVDEFNEDPDITVFLLSTKAGGVGINLTAASVVVIYDQDFNPHNDRQAADRAYRIGQEKEVEVIKFITKGSIDEDMLAIGMTKLQLDDAVGGEEITLDGQDGAGADDKTAKETRKSLLTTLRSKFVVADDSTSAMSENGDGDGESKQEVKEEKQMTPVKIARGKVGESQLV